MDDKGALRPFSNIQGFIKEPQIVNEEILSDDETTLGTGANGEFWKALKVHFNNTMLQLEAINDSAIENGMPLEEIGRNALVISQVKGVLSKIVNTVEDAKEALDARGGEK